MPKHFTPLRLGLKYLPTSRAIYFSQPDWIAGYVHDVIDLSAHDMRRLILDSMATAWCYQEYAWRLEQARIAVIPSTTPKAVLASYASRTWEYYYAKLDKVIT